MYLVSVDSRDERVNMVDRKKEREKEKWREIELSIQKS